MSEFGTIHARLDPSPFRRWAAVLITAGIGVVLVYLAAARPMGHPGATLSVVGLGVVFLWISYFIHKATSQSILFVDAGLVLEGGKMLAEIENIDSVDRSIMAFKPSNGFAIKLKQPKKSGWSPGIWWRAGTRMGIGGATSRDQAREMADCINVFLHGSAPNQ